MPQQHARTVGEVAALTHVTIRTCITTMRSASSAPAAAAAPATGSTTTATSIGSCRSAPDFDRGRALREQRALLAAQGERLRAMLLDARSLSSDARALGFELELGDQLLAQIFYLEGDDERAEEQARRMGVLLLPDDSLHRGVEAWRARYLDVVADALR